MTAGSKSTADRIAAEVAARYGVRVDPAVVRVVPVGACTAPGYVWCGKTHQLILLDREAGRERYRRAMGSASRKARGAIPPTPEIAARRAAVAGLHGKGHHTRAIADQLGLTYSNVSSDLVRLGLTAHLMPAADRIGPGVLLKRDKMLALARAGADLAEIAAAVGMTAKHVAETLKLHGGAVLRPTPRQSGRKGSAAAARRGQLVALLDRGLCGLDIAAACGVSPFSVRVWCKALGLVWPGLRSTVPTRLPNDAARTARAAEVVARYLAGETAVALAGAYRLDQGTIYRLLRDAGIARVVGVPPDPRPPRGSGLTAERAARIAQIRVLAAEGRTRAEIAAALGLPISLLASDCRRGNIAVTYAVPARRREAPLRLAKVAARRALVAELRETGHSLIEIGKIIGVGRSAIDGDIAALGLSGTAVARQGPARRQNPAADPAVIADVLARTWRGLRPATVARAVGLSVASVARIVAGAEGMRDVECR